MNSLLRSISSDSNLSISQYFTLQSIPPDGVSMSELAGKLGIDNSTLTRNINVLIKLQLVTKIQSKSDKREYIAILTQDAYLLIKNLEVEFDKAFIKIILDISSEEKSQLSNIIEKINWKINCKIHDL